ncbi:MAG: hypothetical protein HY900_17000 [Deltaproteobacteria bacterium]|nr:hypothetical protein [Deltaproteobacteria bacterium]
MRTIQRALRRGVPVIRLVGEVGAESAEQVGAELYAAFKSSDGRVLLDLRPTVHLHYRVAALLVGAALCRRRLGVVGPTPYIRQILRFAGALEEDVREYRDLGEALGDPAA